MNELSRIRQLNEKMQHLLETVGKNGGRFSQIDKDLLSGYVRELYELAVSIQPSSNISTPRPIENIIPPEPQKKEEAPPAQPDESTEEHKQNGVKRTITEIYSDRNTNGKTS